MFYVIFNKIRIYFYSIRLTFNCHNAFKQYNTLRASKKKAGPFASKVFLTDCKFFYDVVRSHARIAVMLQLCATHSFHRFVVIQFQ